MPVARAAYLRWFGLAIIVLVVESAVAFVAIQVASRSPASPVVRATAVTPSPSLSPSGAASPPAAVGPWPRMANLAYDSTRGQILVFGGLVATSGDTNETWVWDGHLWIQKMSVANPSVREGSAIADDPDHHVVVLFGGVTAGGNYQGDTWLWDGSGWNQALPAHSPSPRTGAAITYDLVHHVVLLFGGAGGGNLNDTWVWDGTDWTEKSTTTSPSARQSARLAFDAAHGNAVLYGGQGGLDDTWTWDGSAWTPQHPSNTPPGYRDVVLPAAQMAYDAARKAIVFVDPTQQAAATAQNTMDTWTWDSTTWTRLGPAHSPPGRDAYGLAYDAAHSITVFAGGSAFGNGDATSTWGWDGADWSKLA